MSTDHLPLNTENGTGVLRAEQLVQELSEGVAEVARRLQDSLSGLYPPLINLAQAHCRDVQPYLRAAIVLSAGDAQLHTEQPKTGQPHDQQTRERLILVASALEMLSVALSIHRLLLLPNTDTSLDKALVGSTILTGDYCFSRAAVLAAQTESPVVVNIFSQALKQVSEENLRILFADKIEDEIEDEIADEIADKIEDRTAHQRNTHGEDEILAQAGIRAAFHLLHQDTDMAPLQTELAILVARREISDLAQRLQDPDTMRPLGPFATARWKALLHWFSSYEKPAAVTR